MRAANAVLTVKKARCPDGSEQRAKISLVEAGGIEPPSEKVPLGASTGILRVHESRLSDLPPHGHPKRQPTLGSCVVTGGRETIASLMRVLLFPAYRASTGRTLAN